MAQYGKMWQDMAKCGNACAFKTQTCKMKRISGPSVKTQSVPTPSGSR